MDALSTVTSTKNGIKKIMRISFFLCITSIPHHTKIDFLHNFCYLMFSLALIFYYVCLPFLV